MTKKIFESIDLGGISIKNRLLRSATGEHMCTDDGEVTTRLLKLYEELSAGGVGLIISGLMEVVKGTETGKLIKIDHNNQVEGLKMLADVVHQNGSKVVAQLVHHGPQVQATENYISLSPSGIENMNSKEASIEEIKNVIEAFGDGALRAKNAGFDGVQIHAAHGYFLGRFLTPFYNKRTDIYGGTIENRSRILIEVIRNIRKKCGSSYPLYIKINGSDYMEKDGLNYEDSKKIIERLVEEGINAIEISGGTFDSLHSPARPFINKTDDEAYHLSFAEEIAKHFNVSIISVGGYRSIDIIETVLNTTEVEAVALCRPFIAEPDLAKRWNNGNRSKSKCVSCNKCSNSHGIECIFNKS